MTTLRAYRRADGEVGIRNHLFTLPAVVCANQVAIDISRRHSRLKYIEHQHGCAQIGADLVQTQRVFTRLALHPNVYASMIIGLGCEGIMARELFADARSRTRKPLDLVVIQESGGTLGAENAVQQWVMERGASADSQLREPVEWREIVVGVMFDADVNPDSPLVTRCLRALSETGIRMVLPDSHPLQVNWAAAEVPVLAYGAPAVAPISVMARGGNALETATGLTACGAHLLLHLASRPHAFGSPLAPTLRWCVRGAPHNDFYDDFDGQLQDELDVPRIVEQMARIINGHPSIAEELVMDDFALYRIGPTV